MNNLTVNNNWIKFNTLTEANVTFNQFLDLIKQLDNNSNPDLWVKWKNFSNQTEELYY